MIRKQLIGALGAFAALVVMGLAYGMRARLGPGVALPLDDPASRLAYAVRWLAVPGMTLAVGVVLAARRGFHADAIDGTRTPADHGLEINLRYNTNTVEQVVLAAVAWPGLAISLPHDQLTLIPLMAGLFMVGRASFWIGYLIHPMGRTFGMTMTIVPTLFAYGWLAWRACGPPSGA